MEIRPKVMTKIQAIEFSEDNCHLYSLSIAITHENFLIYIFYKSDLIYYRVIKLLKKNYIEITTNNILKLDIFLLSIILSLIIFDFYKLNLVKNTTQIVIFIFTILIAYLIFKFEIILTNLYLLQIILIISTILVKKYRFILFYISIIIFCIIAFSIIFNDRYFFYLIIGISFFNDTVAYIFGSTIKGPLILPKISQNIIRCC